MANVFSKIGLNGIYKVEKSTYSRNDISEIGLKLGKKVEQMEYVVDYERRKCEVKNRELA